MEDEKRAAKLHRLTAVLDPEIPSELELFQATRSLKKGHVKEVILALFQEHFDLRGDLKPQVSRYLDARRRGAGSYLDENRPRVQSEVTHLPALIPAKSGLEVEDIPLISERTSPLEPLFIHERTAVTESKIDASMDTSVTAKGSEADEPGLKWERPQPKRSIANLIF
jgi:hypothetical protein